MLDYENEGNEEDISISIKRVQSTRNEYNLLMFNVTAAAILFKEI